MIPLTLACSGFHATYHQVAVIAVSCLLSWVSLALLVHVPSSAAAQFLRRARILSLPMFIVGAAIALPQWSLSGAFSPAHVDMDVSVWIWPLVCLVLIVKTVSLNVRELRAARTKWLLSALPQ